MHPSWHIPHLKTWDQPSPNDVLHVVFLQRLPKHTRQEIVDNLANVNAEWASEFDPSGLMSRPRQLRTIPWIRDSWPTSEMILEILSIQKDKYQSFILVDSLWEASIVVAAHWTTDEDGESELDAVRVSMSMANVLLTLIDNDQISDFAQVLGEEVCDESKVDLYADGSLQSCESKELPSYEQPPFLPHDLRLDRRKLKIVSLRELSQEQIDALRSDILRNSSEVATVPSIIIHNWTGPSPSRDRLRQLYDRMNQNSAAGDRNSLAWFVDNIIEGDDHSPRVVALAADVRPRSSQSVSQSKVSLFPLRREDVLPLFNGCMTSDTCYENAHVYSDCTASEDVVALHNPIDFGNGDASFCPVFSLCPFNADQERAIRVALNEEDQDIIDENGKDYAYFGYLFQPESGTHTMEDLFDLFQKCDQLSPSFDSTYSDMRFKNYPGTFVAVDLKCLDVENPKVGMADAEHSWFEPPDNGATHCTGWSYGTTKPGMAWTSYVNLWIANMDSFELFDDHRMMYLHDLQEYEEEMKEEENEE